MVKGVKAWAYYNEIDPKKAEWLRELIKLGLIAPGDVDERSIVEVQPDDLRGYRQCHFFAGIGIWSYALLTKDALRSSSNNEPPREHDSPVSESTYLGREATLAGWPNSDGPDTSAEGLQRSGQLGQQPQDYGNVPLARGPVNGFWRNADWVLTRPQRVGDRPSLRPVEGRSFPLAHESAEGMGRSGDSGFPLAKGEEARIMRLRGYGDGIVAELACGIYSRLHGHMRGWRATFCLTTPSISV